jgi:hypothetical protein
MDVVEDVFENIDRSVPREKLAQLATQTDREREKEVKSLSAFYQEYSDHNEENARNQIKVSAPE